ncbi:hypothetical protein P154DRAFT_321462 [Amniculicola lignicola CBS 123094]|uniref:Uncharacterized protein n=1 Tax=Amniculicola lignicola CBS 123094 TaxID=1392246 RepID=A0A6A5W5Z6_9PLEO|nr:hypothetical protein P154DRAFT_321462 [Amniculicola lignicola CBS 123094]
MRGFPGDDHHYFKGRVLHFINIAMADPETAVSEENISSVASQCMYENIRGSDIIGAHLKGLRQMIDMRGGINNLSSDQGCLGEISILQDAIHACCSNVSPFMIDITDPVLREVRSLGPEQFYPQSPLRIVNDVGLFRPHTELESSVEILKDAFDGFEMLCLEVFDPTKAAEDEEISRFRRDKSFSRLRPSSVTFGNELPSSALEKAEEAIRLAARIHFRAVALRMPHDDEVNVEDMTRLHTVLRNMDMQFWKVAHYVYLWILLTGGAASHGHPDQRPYFVSEQMRLGLSIGLLDWRSFKQTLGNFLWLQQFLRREKSVQPTGFVVGST